MYNKRYWGRHIDLSILSTTIACQFERIMTFEGIHDVYVFICHFRMVTPPKKKNLGNEKC